MYFNFIHHIIPSFGIILLSMMPENKSMNQEINELERIRMLENRMRKPGKTVPQEQSLRSIKSTDSKKMFPIQVGKPGYQAQQNIHEDQSQEQLKLQIDIKNNRKITDYFSTKTIVSSAKKQQTENTQKKQNITHNLNPINNDVLTAYNNENTSPNLKQEAYLEQIKSYKEKIKIKEENFVAFKNKIKKQMLDVIIKNHKLKRNEMRLRINNNKIRLGEFHIQKKGNDFWVDGAEIRQVREKIQAIVKQKEELERSKKFQSKKSNKQYVEDPEEWKNALASQMHFLSRQEAHLHQQLKRLEEEKTLHIKQLKLLYDQQFSKYGKADIQTGTCNWPKIGQYQLLGLLGKGGFSEVYKAYDTQQFREVACKLHQLNPQWAAGVKQNFVKHALREQQVHKMLNHPNIVKLYGTVQIDQSAFCTILEYCQGPDLSYYLKKHRKLPEKEAKMIIKQVINAIKYLHELPEKVIHYDLKPQNIIFHKGRVKITDFGLCKKTNEQIIELTSQGVGTYWYLPPECFVAQKPQISPKVDIWSIGVIYFEMLYGEKPFGNQMSQLRVLNEGIMLKANLVNFPNTARCTISNQSKQFIRACLKANVDERCDIKGAANHPLFEKK